MSITRTIRSHLSSKVARRGLAALSIAFAAPCTALAEPLVFISQPHGGEGNHSDIHYRSVSDPAFHGAWQGSPGPTPMVVPELTAPGKSPNLAGNLTVGNFNSSIQLQTGRRNHSLVGIIGGHHDTVNVLQLGNGLQSNILLINPPPGLNLSFVQQPNSAPLDLLIARLASGKWIIKK